MGRSWNPFRRKDAASDGVLVIAQLNAMVQPIDRYGAYEEPLADLLQKAGLGQVTGGGTMLLPDHAGIQYCDVEMLLQDTSPETLAAVVQGLERLGAPKGSLLMADGLADIPFGTTEGMGIFLNGTDLPDEVYETSDVNEVIETCDRVLEGVGAFCGHWDGPTETGLFFYGDSYAAMKSAVTAFTDGHPLCAQARFEQIA